MQFWLKIMANQLRNFKSSIKTNIKFTFILIHTFYKALLSHDRENHFTWEEGLIYGFCPKFSFFLSKVHKSHFINYTLNFGWLWKFTLNRMYLSLTAGEWGPPCYKHKSACPTSLVQNKLNHSSTLIIWFFPIINI